MFNISRHSRAHWFTSDPAALVARLVADDFIRLDVPADEQKKNELARLWRPCCGAIIVRVNGYLTCTGSAAGVVDALARL